MFSVGDRVITVSTLIKNKNVVLGKTYRVFDVCNREGTMLIKTDDGFPVEVLIELFEMVKK